MIKSLTVTNYRGESLEITLANPWETGLLISKIEGIGAPDADIHISDFATADGGYFGNARATPREFSITFKPLMKSNVEQSRHRIYRYFPIKQKCTIQFNTTERTSAITGYVSKIEPDIFRKDEVVKVTLECTDPYFYDTRDLLGHVFSGSDPMFEFPFSNDITEFPRHKHYYYSLSTGYTQFVRDTDYYLTLPDGLGDIQFNVPGDTVTNGSFYGTIFVHTIDDRIIDGTITLNSSTTEEVPIAARTTAETKAFTWNPQTGYEYWSAVVVDPRYTLNANTRYHILIPDRGHYNFINTYEVSNQTSFEISLKLTNGAITPDEVSIDKYLYKAQAGNSGTNIFDGAYTVELKYFEYSEADAVIQKTDEIWFPTYTKAKELIMSEVRNESEHNFEYEGDAETGMIMTMQANNDKVGEVTIYDLSSGLYFTIYPKKIETITGEKFSRGDQIIVSTKSGDKYVRLLRRGEYTNVINILDKGSTWFTMKPGINSFAYLVDAGIDSLDFKINYNVAYQGV